MKDARVFSIEKHRETNHLYAGYLPYEFHLRMVNKVANDFKHLLDSTEDYFTGQSYRGPGQGQVTLQEACLNATWAHDLIEDTRLTYNDVKDALGYEVAEIVYALTNEKGKNRKERANDKYYEGIRNTKGATFVKLCDRIANVKFSKLEGSSMFKVYKKEQADFEDQLMQGDEYKEMWTELQSLFK